jgi:hypothetical protein
VLGVFGVVTVASDGSSTSDDAGDDAKFVIWKLVESDAAARFRQARRRPAAPGPASE